MCCTSGNSQEIGTEKKFRLADFFDRHWDATWNHQHRM